MNLNLLKETFVSFIRARGMDRHFRRLGMDMFRSAPVTKEVPQTLAEQLSEASRSEVQALLQRLQSRPDGLTESEADAIREHSGPNEVEHEKPLTWYVHLWHCYKNPFNLLLTLLAAVSFYTEDMKAAIVIGTMVVVSTLLRFVQEARSNTAADKLKAMVSNTATVMRHDQVEEIAAEAQRYFDVMLHPKGARRVEVPIHKLVPGDIVLLSAGDMIPADLRLLAAKDLFVSQAAMTGESLPVEKFVTPSNLNTSSPLELDNLCFMGTNVVRARPRAWC